MKQKRSKWFYATGCTCRDMTYILVSLFLLTYIQYTNLVNKEQFVVLSIIIVLCRVWDAVNDPMMGTIISNTKTRFGKFRPWILIGAITNAIALACMFNIRVDVGSSINTLGWYNVGILGGLYLLWSMTYTMNDVSFWSILPVLAENKKDRDTLTTMLTVFASLGSFIAGGLVPMLTPSNPIRIYGAIGIIFAGCFLISQIIVFFMVHDNKDDTFIERNTVEKKEENITLKQMFKIVFSNNQLLVIAIVFLFANLGSAILNAFGQNFFYFKYGYNGTEMFIFTVIYAAGTLLSQALFPMFAKRFSRMKIAFISVLILSLGYLLFFIFANIGLPQSVSFILLCASGVFVFIGQGIFYMVMLIMLTNTIEYDEWKSGKRNDAIVFSVRPFIVKLAGAIQYLLVSVTLVICGLYTITEEIGKVVQSISLKEITEEAGVSTITEMLSKVNSTQMLLLTLCMTIVPVILYVIGYIITKKKYIIDEEMYDKMIAEIAERKNTIE